MRYRHGGVWALLVLAGCASDGAGPTQEAGLVRGASRTALTGQVLGFTVASDSSLVPVRGAEIVIYRVDSIPPDTIPVDSIPSDSAPNGSFGPRPMLSESGTMDTFPVDTIPPDTTPPPPIPGCGRSGEIVARVVTREGGRFRVLGLLPAKYDLQIRPPEGSVFGQTDYCGVHLLERQATELTIYLPQVR